MYSKFVFVFFTVCKHGSEKYTTRRWRCKRVAQTETPPAEETSLRVCSTEVIQVVAHQYKALQDAARVFLPASRPSVCHTRVLIRTYSLSVERDHIKL